MRIFFAFMCCVACLTTAGCFQRWTETADPVPVIGDDPRPKIDWSEETAAWKAGELTSREKAIINKAFRIANYAEIRDARIAAYNEFAEGRNRRYREQGDTLKR